MSNEDKLYEVDTFLAMCEDFMHGKDGDDATKCRRLISELIKELSKLQQSNVSGRSEQLLRDCSTCGTFDICDCHNCLNFDRWRPKQ